MAAAVQTVREPREYMLSPFSEWVRVNRIVPVTESEYNYYFINNYY